MKKNILALLILLLANSLFGFTSTAVSDWILLEKRNLVEPYLFFFEIKQPDGSWEPTHSLHETYEGMMVQWENVASSSEFRLIGSEFFYVPPYTKPVGNERYAIFLVIGEEIPREGFKNKAWKFPSHGKIRTFSTREEVEDLINFSLNEPQVAIAPIMPSHVVSLRANWPDYDLYVVQPYPSSLNDLKRNAFTTK